MKSFDEAGARLRLTGYASVTKVSFLEFTAYKADVILQFLTYPVVFIAYFFFITGAFSRGLSQTGYTVSQLVTYYSLGWLLRMLNHHGTDLFISQSILQGSIATVLLKPLDFHGYTLANTMGKVFARGLFYCVPAFVLLSLFLKRFVFAADLSLLFFFAFSVLGFLICFELQYLIGCLAFNITVNFQVSWIMDMIIRLASGLIVPLSLFPGRVARFLELLPFQYIYFVPIQIWLKKIDPARIGPLFAIGLVWLAALYLLNRRMFDRGIRKLTIFGG